MASTLKDLRREAGYQSAREFAEGLGMPASTYARWESSPTTIPPAQAWALADGLGCSMDQVYGRRGAHEEAPVQRAYDGLSERSQRDATLLLSLLAERDVREGEAARGREARRWEILAARYERVFVAEQLSAENPDELVRTVTEAELREAFGDFLRRRLAGEGDEPTEADEARVQELLAAYDRIHEGWPATLGLGGGGAATT